MEILLSNFIHLIVIVILFELKSQRVLPLHVCLLCASDLKASCYSQGMSFYLKVTSSQCRATSNRRLLSSPKVRYSQL